MIRPTCCDERLYRVWIVRYADWQPTNCREQPPQPRFEFPADAALFTAAEAAWFVDGFNREMLRDPLGYWAIALPRVCGPGGSASLLPTALAGRS